MMNGCNDRLWVTGNGWSLSGFLLGQCMWDEHWMDLATTLWIAMLMEPDWY